MIAELVRRAQNGDAEAYTELVRRFQDAVFATAYHTVLDFEAARDIAQDTFIRAYEKISSLRDPASFPGWVVRICRNRAASWLRNPRRQCLPLDAVTPPTRDIAPVIEARDLVRRALSAVPEDNRLALSLFLVNGYTYKEVANLTEVPVTTVKGRIERAKRKLATEVLAMAEDNLKTNAPDEEFTLDTVRKSLEKAGEALDSYQWVIAKSAAEEALETLSDLAGDEDEVRSLRLDALNLIQASTSFADKQCWREAVREGLSVCEESGDMSKAGTYLYELATGDQELTQTERDALLQRCFELLREHGENRQLGYALFQHAWGHIGRDHFETGFQFLGQARTAIKDEPYGSTHACLDATDEFQRLTDDGLDTKRMVEWGAGCDVAQLDGERLVHHSQPGSSWHTGKREEMAKCTNGFHMLLRTGWLPYTGPAPGYEEEKTTFSYTGNPTQSRIWIEADDVSVTTPVGDFDDCLLMRATTTESPLDVDAESREGQLNKVVCGERYCWLARGVGPVAFRAEREDDIVEHAVLSKFECLEQREEWVPLVVGTRWEYVPAEPPEDFDALVVVRLTHLDEDDTAYLATTSVGNRHRV